MLINYTNHPQQLWSKEQTESAQYGEIIDMPFPAVSPYATTEEVQKLAVEEAKKYWQKERAMRILRCFVKENFLSHIV